MIQDSPFARFIGHGISAMTAIGDSPHDSEEEKLAHHHLIYIGVLMSCGANVWSAIRSARCYTSSRLLARKR